MQSSSYFPSQSPPQKVKNILIRHSCHKKVRFASPYQPPEGSYILKYSPKYYQSLTLQLTLQNALLSKIKKIKKLKAFTGLYKDEIFQKLWLNLLANNRKEIEETPQIEPNKCSIMISASFSIKLNTQKMKYFPNVTRLARPRWDFDYLIGYYNDVLTEKGYFAKYLENMRKLKSIEMLIKDENFDEAKWIIAKLDKMSRMLSGLETFSIKIRTRNQNSLKELFQYKNVFSHLTGLDFPDGFHPIFAEIPQRCKNLKSLSLKLKSTKDKNPEIFTLLTSIQKLAGLKSLDFSLPEDAKLFWNHFKPQSSLRYLALEFNASDLMNENNKDVGSHWEEIKELEILELKILCNTEREITLVRFLTTNILKKIHKLRSLKVLIGGSFDHLSLKTYYEPFLVEEVPHLYESLERFEYNQWNSSKEDVKIDLKMKKMELFRKLKEVKLGGEGICFENMDKIVDLLQENQKEERDYPTLKINIESRTQSQWLKEPLQKIQKIKRMDRNLKIAINLAFKNDRPGKHWLRNDHSLLETLEGSCQDIRTAGTIKGLVICLNLENNDYFGPLPVEDAKRVLKEYAGIRNLNVCLKYPLGSLEYFNTGGEKTQFVVNDPLNID